ncbi:serine/threonine protein phosphatase [Cerasicoccus maritimus]|uniref:serine/threonine protein phosphatase n=1 Tax=Cerasicoccus maritimus TaxID=490089 RepID=UPI0028524B50|nr:serine/threonine protein phosphatase [Cerasicoccus maritimus]
MQGNKDTKQAKVRIGYDGLVRKNFLGPMAKERFENELRVLKYLEEKGCDFVPRVIDCDPDTLFMVTTNCGKVVESISDNKLKVIFDELESYGVRHEDNFARNVTYSAQLGRFCLIDFEFATILETGEGLTVEEVTEFRLEQQRRQVD